MSIITTAPCRVLRLERGRGKCPHRCVFRAYGLASENSNPTIKRQKLVFFFLTFYIPIYKWKYKWKFKGKGRLIFLNTVYSVKKWYLIKASMQGRVGLGGVIHFC